MPSLATLGAAFTSRSTADKNSWPVSGLLSLSQAGNFGLALSDFYLCVRCTFSLKFTIL